jgi:hypothetical protein
VGIDISEKVIAPHLQDPKVTVMKVITLKLRTLPVVTLSVIIFIHLYVQAVRLWRKLHLQLLQFLEVFDTELLRQRKALRTSGALI